jgi:hypothetical protein
MTTAKLALAVLLSITLCSCSAKRPVSAKVPVVADVAETLKPDAGYVHDDQGCFKLKSGQQVPCPPSFSTPDPIDVPAISARTDKVCVQYSILQWDGNQCDKYEDRKRWTCADPNRVLEHDENTPPKFWCRKVQP